MEQEQNEILIESLVSRLIEDDENAFCEIYSIYKNKLLYFAMKFVKSREFAEDICHDTFFALWQNRHYLDVNLSFSSFLYTIARNRILYMMRKAENEKQLKENISSQAINYNEDTHDFVSINELKAILSQATDKLPRRQREVFEMSREKGMSHKEIAEVLGVSIHTVQEYVSASLKAIHQELKKNYGTHYSSILLLLLLLKY